MVTSGPVGNQSFISSSLFVSRSTGSLLLEDLLLYKHDAGQMHQNHQLSEYQGCSKWRVWYWVGLFLHGMRAYNFTGQKLLLCQRVFFFFCH